MQDDDRAAQRFEEHRPRLSRVAYRMLGSASEAEDAVQETWIRFSRSEVDSIENLGGWLTTVLSRLCLNILESRRSHPEVTLDPDAPEPVAGRDSGSDPEHEALLADSIGLALLIVLDTLSPAERVAFVLHDMFGVSFEVIGPIVGRGTQAARQLASRGRRRVQGGDPGAETDRLRQAKLVDAFLAAARGGEFDELLALLDPDVVLRADPAAVEIGVAAETQGSEEVAEFSRQARGAKPAFLGGVAAAVWMRGDRPRVVYEFAIDGEKIVGIDLIADPDRLRRLDLEIVDG